MLDYAEYLYCSAVELRKRHDRHIELHIAANPFWAFYYARDVIKGRWPEAEPYIAKDLYWSYYYAQQITQGRFVLAESVISSDPWYADQYIRMIVCQSIVCNGEYDSGKYDSGYSHMHHFGYHIKNLAGFL